MVSGPCLNELKISPVICSFSCQTILSSVFYVFLLGCCVCMGRFRFWLFWHQTFFLVHGYDWLQWVVFSFVGVVLTSMVIVVSVVV